MTPFDSAFSIAEMSAFIMDSLALSAIIALSFTSKTNYVRVHGYIRSKLAKCLAPFRLRLNDVIQQLALTDCLIVGSIALKAVGPATLPITTYDLDIVAEEYILPAITHWLEDDCGYQLIEGSNDAFTNFILKSHSYTRQIEKQNMVINILVVKSKYQVAEFIFRTSNTTRMNMISRDGLFTGYRSLLNQRLAARNVVTRMGGFPDGPFDATAQGFQRQSDIDVRNNLKDESNGFTFVTSTPFQCTWNRRTCSCTRLSSCPSTPRHSNDSMCSFMPLFDDTGYADIRTNPRKIPISPRKVPLVFWRLPDAGDAGDGGNGFVFDSRRLSNT